MATEDDNFPTEGTDRRPDELERNLQGEAGAIESKRVADEDRFMSGERATVLDARSQVNRNLIDVLAIFLMILLLLSVGTAAVAWKTAGDVRDVEKTDRNSQRATAFRLCTRNRIDRAFAHSSIAQRDPKRSRHLMQTQFLPILNCVPNLDGLSAEPMTIPDQMRFVREWESGKLSGAEVGVCPGRKIGDKLDGDSC